MSTLQRSLLFWSALAAGAVAVFIATRGGDPATAAPRHVVLFTLDTTRADALGSYGGRATVTPHLDQLAASGVRFDAAISPSPITGPAHAALLTGRYPARYGVRDNATTPLPEEAVTLAERLRDAGFATGAFIGAFVLDRPYGFAQGFGTFGGFDRVEAGREANAERRGDAVVDEAIAWLGSVSTDQRVFLWVHLYDPHAPYAAPAPFAGRHPDQPYLDEVAYMDAQIGRVLDALRTRGLFDDSLILAIADHGESLGEHGEDEHGVFLYEPVIRVPFIVSGPSVQEGLTVSEQVRSIDVTPTVLDLVGLPKADDADGESLTALLRGGSRTTVPVAYAESYYPKWHYGWSELRALRADGWKVIDAPRPELYAIDKDARESANLFTSQQALASRMIAEAKALERSFTGGRTVTAAAPSPDTLERLRSLGYVGTSAPPLDSSDRGPDPKDRIEERRTFKRLLTTVIDQMGAGRLDEAERGLRELIRINDRAFDLHEMLGEVYARQNRPDAALGEFEMAALLNPAAASPLLSAAELQLRRGNVRDARARWTQANTVAPQSFDVALVDGLILEAEGRAADAMAAYRRAIGLNPAAPRPRMMLVRVASQLRDFATAESELRTLLDAGHQPSRMHLALGQLSAVQGRLAEAERHYVEALRIEPGLRIAEDALRALRGGR
ncbi:MAG: sulfatase-like hydrolase/transferase [Vicinamibacterales bacterium]